MSAPPGTRITRLTARYYLGQLSAGEWLKHLLATASSHYQTLAGGRGFFRIPRDDYAALLKLLSA